MRVSHLLPLLALACGSSDKTADNPDTATATPTTPTPTPTGTDTLDVDGDGFSEEDGDCDDNDAAAYPGALEICDGVDNDCNGLSDELASAATLDATTNFATIQEALDVATAGASIRICDGIWGGPLTIATTVHLSSVSGEYDCTIDGQSQGTAITVTAPDVVISAVTVTGGLGAAGGGINGLNAARLKVELSIITLNTADFGGGMYFGDDNEVVGTVITQNTALSYGGGIAVKEGATGTATNATVEDNNATLGGGAFLYEGSSLNALGITTFSDNAASTGGGIYVWSGNVDGPEIEGNDALFGGGLYFLLGGNASDILLVGNTALHGGGAMIGGLVTLTDVTVTANDATIEGGGVIVEDGSLFCLGSTSIDSNTTDDDGAGAMVRNGTIVDCEIANNHALDSAGGVMCNGDFNLTNVVIRDNSSDVRAGGIYANGPWVGIISGGEIEGNNSVSWGGGIYANNGADVAIDGTMITGNTSDFGAGMYINQDSVIAVSNATVENNGDVATTTGGGARIGRGDLVSTNTGWGSGADDNIPDDVVAGAGGVTYIGYEATETFTCDEWTCSPIP